MAKSGFVPAWMKIQSSDKTNLNQKFNIDRSTNHNPQIQTSNKSETSSTSSSSPPGQCKIKSNDADGQSDEFFTFSSSNSQIRRSFSRERLTNSFSKNLEINGNGYRSINNNSQRRLHSVSSYSNGRQSSIGFDRLEQDFPSLNGREKNQSSSNDQSSSVWNNAASKLRTSHHESFKLFDRSLSNKSNRFLTRKDRLLSTPSGLNGTTTTTTTTTTTNRSVTLELQTNCRTQTKNLDKRSDFFNSLKNVSINDENKHQYNDLPKRSTNENYKRSKGILLLLSLPETIEEKEFLIRMGWNEFDDLNYEITDQDKEEYEKRIKLFPKTNHRSTTLLSALRRRALPCIDIRAFLRFQQISSTSDDESSDE